MRGNNKLFSDTFSHKCFSPEYHSGAYIITCMITWLDGYGSCTYCVYTSNAYYVVGSTQAIGVQVAFSITIDNVVKLGL